MRRKFEEQMPEVSFSFEPSDIVSRVMSLGSPTPIEVAVSGLNLEASLAFAQTVKDRLQHLPALRDVQFGQSLDYPTVDVMVDRQKAGLLGVKMADVSRSLAPATWSSRFDGPQLLGRYQQRRVLPGPGAGPPGAHGLAGGGEERADRQARGPGPLAGATSPRSPRDRRRPVSALQYAAAGDGDSQYRGRRPRQRGRAGGGCTQGTRPPPAGVNVALRGQIVPLQQMLDGLRAGLLLALVVIFLLLAANFQSLKLSFLVVATTPAVIAGVVLMLWLTGTTLNIQSFMGAIMAIGVAVANAILLVTFAERARVAQTYRLPISSSAAGAGGTPELLSAADAAVEGARSRLRPILMTSMAMIAGMVPMALGLGEGGEQRCPLGRAVIGGLASATVATLLFLPAAFALIQGPAHRRSASLHPDDSPGPSSIA